MTLSYQQKMAACVLALYWPALFVLAHISIPRVVQEADVSDKSLHFLAYLVLTFLLWTVLGGNRKVKWLRVEPWLVLFVIVMYGILDEWLQDYVAGRSCDVRDFFFDLAGAFTCLTLSSFLTFWPAGLAVTAIFIFGITNVTRANMADVLPVVNVLFNFFAYAILTALWINCIHIFSTLKIPKARWFLLTMAGPIGFLIIVKLFSVIDGRELVFADIITAFGAIAAVTLGFHVRRSVCRVLRTND